MHLCTMNDQFFLVYKPWRMVSQFLTNDLKQKKKRFLGDLGAFPTGSMAVGRLDEDSEGLLLITTSGKWSDAVNKSAVWDKEYYVQIDGFITDKALYQLQQGITISVNGRPYKTQPCDVKRLGGTPDLPSTLQRVRNDRHGPTSWISIILNEGKFRQVRKMTSAAGFPTLRLARVRIGNFKIKSLRDMQVADVTHMIQQHPIP